MRFRTAASCLAAAGALLLAPAAARRRSEGQQAAVLAGALFATSLPVLMRERDRRLFWTLIVAEQVKLCAAFACHRAVYRTYGEGTDAHAYDTAARAIAAQLRSGRLQGVGTLARTVPFDTARQSPTGTNAVRLLGGVVYAVTGPSTQGGFVVFSWIGFWGLYLFQRAFALGVPDRCGRDYARLVLFLPSLVFWTSMIGKEAWMVFSLGLAAFGVARALSGPPLAGVALTLIGAALAAVVRPHTPAMLGPGFGSVLEGDRARTALGSSRFEPPALRGPRDFPRVAASVLFRPHPLEAHRPAAMAVAIEGTAVAVLSLVRARRAAAAVACVHRRPYVGFALVSTGALVAMLARVANLGLLVRQRTPVMPFYFVILSIPTRTR